VLTAHGSVFIAADVLGFKNRPASPHGGEGLLVLDAGQQLPIAPAQLTVANAKGEAISSASV
jgi:hypothetical protein